MLKYLLYKEK